MKTPFISAPPPTSVQMLCLKSHFIVKQESDRMRVGKFLLNESEMNRVDYPSKEVTDQ